MIRDALRRRIFDRSIVRLIGPCLRHSKEMRPQTRVRSFGRQLREVRCQPQALELALSVVPGIGHAHLLDKVSDRTPSLALSVVHATEQAPHIRERRFARSSEEALVSYFAQLLAWASRGPGQVDQAEADLLAGFAGLPGVANERRQADAKLQAPGAADAGDEPPFGVQFDKVL
jgi:hypothetical protein